MTPDHLASIRAKAQQGIARRLYADADQTDAALRKLGDEIAARCGSIALYGAIKRQGRSIQKVRDDFGGDWFALTDVNRMTIIAPASGQLKQVQAVIRQTCAARNGMGIAQDFELLAERSPCGYSGIKFVITMPNGRPAEIQANIPAVMYGQMPGTLFQSALGSTSFHSLRGRYGVDGGFGHGLYEIHRVAPASEAGKTAARLSRAYFGLLRGHPDPVNGARLQRELADFARAHPAIFRGH